MAKIFHKPPGAVLDYWVDWRDVIPEGATIASVSAVAEAGLTIDSTGKAGDRTYVVVSGGSEGDEHEVELTAVYDLIQPTANTDKRVVVIRSQPFTVNVGDVFANGDTVAKVYDMTERKPGGATIASSVLVSQAGPINVVMSLPDDPSIRFTMFFTGAGSGSFVIAVTYDNTMIDVVTFLFTAVDDSG